ncbi:hypothetical protein GCM10027018_13510 [Paenibacillus thermoaerophilus]
MTERERSRRILRFFYILESDRAASGPTCTFKKREKVRPHGGNACEGAAIERAESGTAMFKARETQTDNAGVRRKRERL